MEQEQVQKITKDTTIGEIVEKYPQVVEALMSYGVHCVGCHVSGVESLEMGFKGHGMDDATIADAVKKLNGIIEENPSEQQKEEVEAEINDPKLNVTDSAAEKIKGLIAQEKKLGLRITVLPGGCAGYKYGMELEDKSVEDDIVFEEKGIKIIVDKKSMQTLNGSNVDYVDSLQGAGFKIENPNATKSCGCGNSFG
jgi:iron-sulfur cluster assembly accessory protein